MVDYKEIKLVKDGEECVPFAPNKADKTGIDNLVITKASKLELETAVEELSESIPSKVSELENDIPYLSTTEASNAYATKAELSSSVNDLTNIKASKMELETAVDELDAKIDLKQDKLIAGDNIIIKNNIICSTSVPIGTLVQSAVDLGDNYKICDGSHIDDYDNQLNINKIEPVLYRLYNINTQNFHQHIFTTDKDICNKVNPDVSTLYRPIRNGHDCYGMNSTGYVRINQNEEISMHNGVITSKSGFYDGEFETFIHELQIIKPLQTLGANLQGLEYIPYYDVAVTLEGTNVDYHRIAYKDNIVVIANTANVQFSKDTQTYENVPNITGIPYSVLNIEGSEHFIATTSDGVYRFSFSSTDNILNDFMKVADITIHNMTIAGNSYVGLNRNNGTIYFIPDHHLLNWEPITMNIKTCTGDNTATCVDIVFYKNNYIIASGSCLYICKNLVDENSYWHKYNFDLPIDIQRLKIVNDVLFVLGDTISYYSNDSIKFNTIKHENIEEVISYGDNSFKLYKSDRSLLSTYSDLNFTTPLSTPETKAQELQDCTEHNYIQQLDGQYEINCVSKHNDENVRIYSAADTDITVSDNGWLTNAVDGKYLNIGEYNYTTAKWVQTSLIYSGNINSTAGSTNNKICLEFDFITPPTFVAARDIFYAYRTLIFRVADVNGNLNMYMAGYNSSGLKWRYSNKSTGITLDTNTKYHLKFETTGFSTTSPYYTYTLSITPYNILDSTLLENRTQTHTFSLAYLPYNYYSNSSANSMSSIYCADASAWTAGQMLDLRSFKLTWNDHTTYALNNTTKYSDCYNSGIYAPYMKDSHIRIK